MSTNKNYIRETSKDFNSISQDLVASISNITDEWFPADETDPGLVYLKVASMLGDMLSYNRDRGTMAMFPETVTERQDAYKLFKSLGYYMPWYRSAKCTASINVRNIDAGETFILPKYTVFKTKTKETKYTYCGPQLAFEKSSSNSHNSEFGDTYQNTVTAIKIKDIELIQGEAVTPPIITSYKIPVGSTKKWHDVYGYNVSVSDVKNDLYINLPNNRIDQDHITLIDSNGDEWELVENLSQVEYGKYFELYINSYNSAYLKLAIKPSSVNITGFKLFYLLTDGISGRTSSNSLSDIPCTPVYKKSGSTYSIANTLTSISNTSSTGGYDQESSEEAREKFEKMGSKLQTLVTLEDFENDVKNVEGVDQCIAYDLDKYSESCTEFLFDYAEANRDGRVFRRIYLQGSNETGSWEQRFGDCDLWLSSIRIYCDDNLMFSGCGEPITVSDYTKAYKLLYSVDVTNPTTRIHGLDEGTYYIGFGTETEISKGEGPYFDIVFGSTSSTDPSPECPTGTYWIEYMIDRKAHKVGINYVLNDEKAITPGRATITANVESEIDGKKHVYFEPYVYTKPYFVYWSPEGKLYTQQMSQDDAKKLLSTADIYLREKYKTSEMEYGKQLDRTSVEESIKEITSYYLIESSNIAYSIKIDSTNSYGVPTYSSYYFSPEKLNINKLSKSVTITIPNVTLEEVYTSSSQFYQARLFLGENFVIIPNTVTININHGDVVFTDYPINWDKENKTSTVPFTSLDDINYGVLISNDPYAAGTGDVENGNIIFYDTVERPTDEYSYYNLCFTLTAGYYYNEPVDVQITFDTTWDFICKYNGYDPNNFYVAPASIRRNDL